MQSGKETPSVCERFYLNNQRNNEIKNNYSSQTFFTMPTAAGNVLWRTRAQLMTAGIKPNHNVTVIYSTKCTKLFFKVVVFLTLFFWLLLLAAESCTEISNREKFLNFDLQIKFKSFYSWIEHNCFLLVFWGVERFFAISICLRHRSTELLRQSSGHMFVTDKPFWW